MPSGGRSAVSTLRNSWISSLIPGKNTPILRVMSAKIHTLPAVVDEILADIRNLYREQFDRSWFTSSMGDVPMDSAGLQDIRHALSLTSPTVWDLPVLHRGLSALKLYVKLVKRNVLPRAGGNLGHSPLSDPGFKKGSYEQLHRRLAIYTLPMNLSRLSALVDKLEDHLPPVPNAMPSLRTMPLPGFSTV
jgi:hypothetical protein